MCSTSDRSYSCVQQSHSTRCVFIRSWKLLKLLRTAAICLKEIRRALEIYRNLKMQSQNRAEKSANQLGLIFSWGFVDMRKMQNISSIILWVWISIPVTFLFVLFEKDWCYSTQWQLRGHCCHSSLSKHWLDDLQLRMYRNWPSESACSEVRRHAEIRFKDFTFQNKMQASAFWITNHQIIAYWAPNVHPALQEAHFHL